MSDHPLPETALWRTAGGDGTRRGLFHLPVRLRARPQRQLLAHGALQASVVFDGQGRAFVADMSGTVQASSLHGEAVWRATLPAVISATPAVHPSNQRVFVGTQDGWLYALETGQGKTLWRKAIPTRSDPRILSDLLYLPQADAIVLSSWGGRFYALAAASGEEHFSWDAGIFPYAAASSDRDGNVYCLRAVANKGVELVRVNPAGQENVLYRVPEEKRGARRALVTAAPLVDEQRRRICFVANHDQGSLLHAWSLSSNALMWSYASPALVQATPALCHDGTVLIADLAGSIHGVDPDGRSRFSYSSGCEYLLAGGVSEAGGSFFIGDPLGFVHRLDAQGRGKAIFEAKRSIQARPSFGPDGSLFVPSTDRAVYVFQSALSAPGVNGKVQGNGDFRGTKGKAL